MTNTNQQINTNQILEEIRITRNELLNAKELRNVIEASETRLLLKLEEANNKVKNLEEENKYLKTKINLLDKQNRKNNLIIFGLQHPIKIDTLYIVQKLNNLLELDLIENDINDVYTLGKTEKCPIKLELISYQQKKRILLKCKLLKGTNISIANDLSDSQRQEGKLLHKYLQKAKEQHSDKCYIKSNKLYVGKTVYSPKELAELDEEEVIFIKQSTNSAPATPTIDRKQEEIRENLEYGESQCSSVAVENSSSSTSHTQAEVPVTRNKLNKQVLLKGTIKTRSNK